MKQTIKISIAFVILFAVLTMFGCNISSDYEKPNPDDFVKIIIGHSDDFKEYTTNYIEDKMLGEHLDRVIYENGLHAKIGDWTSIGDRYIEELDTLIPTKGEYIFILANDDDPIYTGGMNVKVEYDGQWYYDLNQGLDHIEIRAGVSYLFTIVKWEINLQNDER